MPSAGTPSTRIDVHALAMRGRQGLARRERRPRKQGSRRLVTTRLARAPSYGKACPGPRAATALDGRRRRCWTEGAAGTGPRRRGRRRNSRPRANTALRDDVSMNAAFNDEFRGLPHHGLKLLLVFVVGYGGNWEAAMAWPRRLRSHAELDQEQRKNSEGLFQT